MKLKDRNVFDVELLDGKDSTAFAPASHGTHVSYGGNGSATTVSRSDHTHASVRGAASDNVVVTADTGIMRYDFNIVNSSTGNMPSVNNANGLLTFNTHPGNYYSQLGFSSNGNLYYRSFSNKAIDSTTAWRQISFSDHTHSGYAPASHTHNYLPTTGGTITGQITTPASGALKSNTGDIFLRHNGATATILSNKNGTIYLRPNGDASSTGEATVNSAEVLNAANIQVAGNNVYHTGRKPTAADIGAAASAHNHDSSYSDKSLRKNNYQRITVGGDKNTYYPVQINIGHIAFGFARLDISRGYQWTAPDTWNTSTHRGGLTFSLRLTGDSAWGGNCKTVIVEEFHETYSSMVAGMYLSTNGLLVWLRGGGALYQIESDYGAACSAAIHLDGFTASDGKEFPPRTNTSYVDSEIRSKHFIRSTGIYDGNNRVYSAANKPTASDVGAAPASHTHSTLSSLDISNNLKVFGTSITNGLATFGGGANFGKTKIFFNTTELKDGGPWYGLGNIDLSMGGPTGTPLQLAGYYGLRLRSDTTVIDLEQSNQGPQIYTSYGSVRIGPFNTSYCHFSTDRPKFHFNKHVTIADGQYLSTSNNYGITGRLTDGNEAYMLFMGPDNKIKLGWNGREITVQGTMIIPNMFNDGWYRSRGQVGWFSESYGGGIYMTDSTNIRTYNYKNLYCDRRTLTGHDFHQDAISQNYAGGYQIIRGDFRSRIMYDDGMSVDTYAANGGYHGGTVFKERSIIPRWAGHSGGEGHAPYLGYSSYRWTGAYITNGVTTGSDSKLKENIQPILRNENVRNRAFSNEPAEDITSQDLYDYVKNTGIYRFNYKVTPNKRTVGVIADEIPDNIFNAIGEVSCNEEEYQNKLKQKEDKLKLLETYEVATPLLDKDMNELLSIASSTDDPLCQEIHDAIKEAVETFQESRARIYKEDSSNNRSIYDLEWSNELTTFVNMYVLNNGRRSYKSTDIKDVLCDALINANTREVNDILDFTLIGDTNLTYKELKAAENETVEEPVRLINSSAQIAMLQEVLSMALNKIEVLEKEIDKLKGVI